MMVLLLQLQHLQLLRWGKAWILDFRVIVKKSLCFCKLPYQLEMTRFNQYPLTDGWWGRGCELGHPAVPRTQILKQSPRLSYDSVEKLFIKSTGDSDGDFSRFDLVGGEFGIIPQSCQQRKFVKLWVLKQRTYLWKPNKKNMFCIWIWLCCILNSILKRPSKSIKCTF